jgi:hypothetical protein
MVFRLSAAEYAACQLSHPPSCRQMRVLANPFWLLDNASAFAVLAGRSLAAGET